MEPDDPLDALSRSGPRVRLPGGELRLAGYFPGWGRNPALQSNPNVRQIQLKPGHRALSGEFSDPRARLGLLSAGAIDVNGPFVPVDQPSELNPRADPLFHFCFGGFETIAGRHHFDN